MKNSFYGLIVLIGTSFGASAQTLQIPEPSTKQTILQDFGLGTISISYSRPNTKGRKIFGGIEPYGTVWRTGANEATVLKLTDTVTIAGNKVSPGEYGLFSIPGKTEWTIIINKNPKQWGAYKYDAAQDLLRFTVKTTTTKTPVETFTIQFANVTPDRGELHLIWENTDLSIPLHVDVDARILANIEAGLKGDKKSWFQAKGAMYYYNTNKDINKALALITEADKAIADSWAIKYWKARIQLRAGDKPGAIATAKEGLRLAEKDAVAEYIRLNNEVITAAGK